MEPAGLGMDPVLGWALSLLFFFCSPSVGSEGHGLDKGQLIKQVDPPAFLTAGDPVGGVVDFHRYQPSFHGVDLSALRGAAVDEYFRQPVVVSSMYRAPLD